MKKLILITGLLMIFGISSYGQAQNTSKSKKATETKAVTTAADRSGNFIDKDKNGVCDNFEARGQRTQGRKFTDTDGDGICDNNRNFSKARFNRGNNNCQGLRHRHGWKNQDTIPVN